MLISDSEAMIKTMKGAIEQELRLCVDDFLKGFPLDFKSMMLYPLGLHTKSAGRAAGGKRLRPLLLLSVCHALGGHWEKSVPAATAVELMHNFSLIHDDIQDGSVLRRGKETLWVKWGIPLAINAGDAMLTLSNLESQKLIREFNAEVVLKTATLLQSACLGLTRGQHLDLAYEQAEKISIEDYWQMVEGKTGSLLAACFGLGALLAEKNDEYISKCSSLGSKIGVAFQVQDDWLGIWGDEEITGKSISSDLIERKKTYPVLKGLALIPTFRDYWTNNPQFEPGDHPTIMKLLNSGNLKDTILGEIYNYYRVIEKEINELFPKKPDNELLLFVMKNLHYRST